MSTLRLLSDGDDNFTECSLVIHLKIKMIKHKIEQSFLEAYGLIEKECTHSEIILQTKHVNSGSHKKQALTLFYAALEIHLRCPGSQCFIHQVNTLRTLINPGFEIEKSLIGDHSFSLDSNVSFYLNEAGLELGSSENVDLAQLNLIHKSLLSRVSRKVA
ncbi:MAG TPA: hypothetical protein VNJ08_03215 [Bacteriovoracaceae bacterium]|nr:hypothetical protein [Bacteriovoracaceae bacterium]